MNVEQIKKNYAQMDDWRLERIAKFEVASLLPEVQEIMLLNNLNWLPIRYFLPFGKHLTTS